MTTIQPHRAGLVFALLMGGFHVLWALLVLAGLAQPLMDWVFWLHMIKPVYVIEPFDPARAAGLVAFTACVGYVSGMCLGVMWNRLHR